MSTAPVSTEPYSGPAFDAHDKQYLVIALILAIITGVEVAASYSSLDGAALALPLLLMAAVKFIVVAGYFMHLKLDKPLFRRMFIMGAVLALFCYTAVLYLFHVVSGPVPWVIYVIFAVGVLSVWVFRSDASVEAHQHAHDHDHADHDDADHDHANHDHDHADHDHADHAHAH